MSKNDKPISRLKAARLNHGLSQKEFTKHFNEYINANGLDIKNISYATLSRWENGINEPKQAVWDALSKFLNTYANIRGFQLTFNEKEQQITSLILDFLQPYNFTGHDSYANDDLADLLSEKFNFNVKETGISDDLLYSFNMTDALQRYFSTVKPAQFKELTQKFNQIEDDDLDYDQILELEKKVLAPYLSFTTEITKTLDSGDHDLYSLKNLTFIINWLNKASQSNESKKHPKNNEYNNNNYSLFRNLELPLNQLEYQVQQILEGKTIDKKNILKQESEIKESLSDYFDHINNLLE